jgi:hypothetical protein
VADNAYGVGYSAGGVIYSYGNNHINANWTSDGSPNASLPVQ